MKMASEAASDRIEISERVTIFRTSRSPCWYAQYNLEGDQFKPSLKTRSLKQARALAQKIDAELILGMVPQQRRKATSIRAAVEGYLASQVIHLDPKSLAVYQRDLMQFVVFSEEVAVRKLDGATAEHLERFEERIRTIGPPRIREYLKKDNTPKRVHWGPNRPRTIRSKMKLIRQLMKWSLRRRLIHQDPAPGYRLPPMIKTKPEPFTPDELRSILDTAESPFRDVFDFLRLTGLRSDELCWLIKDDVDPTHRFIYVREKKCPLDGNIWKPKHGHERIVPLATEAVAIVERALMSSPGPWLFHAPHSWGKRPGQFKKGPIWKALKGILKEKGITHGNVHTFRHNFCSFLANQNTSPFLVMKYMGHSSLDIVMNYYHAGKEDLIAAMATVQFDKMLGPTQKPAQSPKQKAQ